MSLLEKYNKEIIRLCELYNVSKLYAFGSVLTHAFNEKSDIDLIVDFKPVDLIDYADNYYDFKFSLEDIFNKKIDLLEEKAIKNPYFIQSINDKKKVIYGS